MNLTEWNNYNKTEIDEFDYRVLSTYKIPNKKIRVGPMSDGGYVIADGFDYDLFISCGIGTDIRFEDSLLDMHSMSCYAFDGTIDSLPYHRNSIEFIKKNVGPYNTKTTTNLKDIIKNNAKIFLKMNIEGSEFNWLDSMNMEELQRFRQIVIEIHSPFDIYRMNMLKKLNNTHYLIHINGNNYCDRDITKNLPSGRTYDGTVHIRNKMLSEIQLPEVFEVTYINKTCLDSASIEKKEIFFSTNLDFPNNPYAKDISFSIPADKSHLIYTCMFPNKYSISFYKLMLENIVTTHNTMDDILIITTHSFIDDLKEAFKSIRLCIYYFVVNATSEFEETLTKLSIYKYPNIDEYCTIVYMETLMGDMIDKLFMKTKDSCSLYIQTPTTQTGVYDKVQYDTINRDAIIIESRYMFFHNNDKNKLLLNDSYNNLCAQLLKIPCIFFQTSKAKPEQYVIDLILSKLTDKWTYMHFNDDEIIDFFQKNPIKELPNIIEKFHNLRYGAHKADLFRYYFLYLKGGVFMDSDAMIYEDIENVVKDCMFFSVNSTCVPNTIFQGILGANPKNPIIKEALFLAYSTNPIDLLFNYHFWCKQLYTIVHRNQYHFKIKLYKELRTDNTGDKIMDNDNNIVFKHYCCTKFVPNTQI